MSFEALGLITCSSTVIMACEMYSLPWTVGSWQIDARLFQWSYTFASTQRGQIIKHSKSFVCGMPFKKGGNTFVPMSSVLADFHPGC